jgi:hypothetical protein
LYLQSGGLNIHLLYNPLQLERVGLAQISLLVTKSLSPSGPCKAFPHKLGKAAFVCNAMIRLHAISHDKSGLRFQAFKYWRRYYYSPASPSSFLVTQTQPVSILSLSWTPSPYLKPQYHLNLVLCIGDMPELCHYFDIIAFSTISYSARKVEISYMILYIL